MIFVLLNAGAFKVKAIANQTRRLGQTRLIRGRLPSTIACASKSCLSDAISFAQDPPRRLRWRSISRLSVDAGFLKTNAAQSIRVLLGRSECASLFGFEISDFVLGFGFAAYEVCAGALKKPTRF